jgi:ABC-type tungstate transport system permease subunit
MGPTLNTAAGMGAYVIADRATWAAFKNRQDLTVSSRATSDYTTLTAASS